METCSTPATLYPTRKGGMENLFAKVVTEGDYKAFKELFNRYYKTLCTYALRVVSVPETAEEVVADVFIKLWKNREHIEVHTSFEAYMYRAVRNQALDYLKLRSYRNREKESLETVQWSLSNADLHTPIEEIIFNEFYDRMEGYICALPRQCQLIFRLSREEGLRYREIADRLKISVKTVETQMGRALKVLRERVPENRLVA